MQGAMSLYKKQSEDRKAKAELLIFKEEEKKVPSPSADEAAVAAPENPPTSEDAPQENTDIIIPTKEDLNAAATTTDAELAPACSPGQEQASDGGGGGGATSTTTAVSVLPDVPMEEGSNAETPSAEDLHSAAEEQPSKAAAPGCVSLENPVPCEEVLMEESGALNVSRIHHSSESTH